MDWESSGKVFFSVQRARFRKVDWDWVNFGKVIFNFTLTICAAKNVEVGEDGGEKHRHRAPRRSVDDRSRDAGDVEFHLAAGVPAASEPQQLGGRRCLPDRGDEVHAMAHPAQRSQRPHATSTAAEDARTTREGYRRTQDCTAWPVPRYPSGAPNARLALRERCRSTSSRSTLRIMRSTSSRSFGRGYVSVHVGGRNVWQLHESAEFTLIRHSAAFTAIRSSRFHSLPLQTGGSRQSFFSGGGRVLVPVTCIYQCEH